MKNQHRRCIWKVDPIVDRKVSRHLTRSVREDESGRPQRMVMSLPTSSKSKHFQPQFLEARSLSHFPGWEKYT